MHLLRFRQDIASLICYLFVQRKENINCKTQLIGVDRLNIDLLSLKTFKRQSKYKLHLWDLENFYNTKREFSSDYIDVDYFRITYNDPDLRTGTHRHVKSLPQTCSQYLLVKYLSITRIRY